MKLKIFLQCERFNISTRLYCESYNVANGGAFDSLIAVVLCMTQKVAGLSAGRSTFKWQPGTSYLRTYASVTKQFSLVPVKGWLCAAAGKVTVGLASLRPCVSDFSGLSTCGLPA